MRNISILTIGDELLIGQVVDTNSAYMAQLLNQHGMEVHMAMKVADTHDAITGALQYLHGHSAVVLMTGGLGPTKDDITKKALADFMQTGMAFSESTWQHIQRIFERIQRPLTPSLREQCYMPENATILHNKMGTAPGMWMEFEGVILISMPGVPYEMKYLMENEVVPRLEERLVPTPILHRTLHTIGMGETGLAEAITDIEDALPPELSLAYLPDIGQVRLRLTARGEDETALRGLLQTYGDAMRSRLQEYVYGEDGLPLSRVIGELLKAQGLKMGTAESCTGGYLASMLTAQAGASAYYYGSVIAYDNSVKISRLGVAPDTLQSHGAVSEATVRAMVAGCIDALGVDVAIAVSGIAGPDGGTPDKPVGTIWIAAGNKEKTTTLLLHSGKERSTNIQYAANRALGLLWEWLVK